MTPTTATDVKNILLQFFSSSLRSFASAVLVCAFRLMGENSIFHTNSFFLASIWCTILANFKAFKGRKSVVIYSSHESTTLKCFTWWKEDVNSPIAENCCCSAVSCFQIIKFFFSKRFGTAEVVIFLAQSRPRESENLRWKFCLRCNVLAELPSELDSRKPFPDGAFQLLLCRVIFNFSCFIHESVSSWKLIFFRRSDYCDYSAIMKINTENN